MSVLCAAIPSQSEEVSENELRAAFVLSPNLRNAQKHSSVLGLRARWL